MCHDGGILVFWCNFKAPKRLGTFYKYTQMPAALLHSFASWWLKKRIHQIELFQKYPNEVQQEVLMELLLYAKDTQVGRSYGFEDIRSYSTFAERVPLTTYEELASDIDLCRKGTQELFWPTPIKWFAKSSGTTDARSKFIPVSVESLEDGHYKSGKDLLCLYLNNNPDSQLFQGKSLRLGGSKSLYEENGSVFGDLSAILIDNAPFWAEMSSTPSSKTSLMGDWDHKLPAIIAEVQQENVTSIAGVPSWMLVLLQQLLAATGDEDLSRLWPQLEVYFHGGVSFIPYKSQYQRILTQPQMKYYEIYNASEGFFAIQDRNDSQDLLLMLDYGIFYEFIPLDVLGTKDQRVLPLSHVVIGVTYAMVITTNAGLWRYQIGDTVRFTSLLPYRIRVVGRTKHHLNAFGEELMIENAEKALAQACAHTGAQIVDYTAAPIFMEGSQKGGHEWFIEFKEPLADEGLFHRIFDQELQEQNSDYEAKRRNNMTLNPPVIHSVRPGLFRDWLAAKGKLGGQHKVPRLSNERTFVEELKKLL